ncbi:hypothetical protein PENTCL1PPCAC_7694, partial [Pristionchus entomophagus]
KFRAKQEMDAETEFRKCLICSSPIARCRFGVDSCRACAVFYRRCLSNEKRVPTECLRGDGKCVERGKLTACRKCRFDRFAEVFKMAKSNDEEDDLSPASVQMAWEPMEPRRVEEEKADQTPFIDHTTFLLGLPSGSSTPLLDQIRWCYSLMCQTLKTAEIGTKPASFPLSNGDQGGSENKFTPVTYSMSVPNFRIFISSLFDFGKMAFPEFAELEPENKRLCISGSFAPVTLIHGTYRAVHHFPNDLDTHFTSYTTIVNDEIMETFLDDCSFVTNKQEAIEALKMNVKRTKSMCRELFHRVKPDNVEFIALLVLAFWNKGVAYTNEELCAAVQKNRDQILKEMHEVYKVRGKTDYAARLGELLSLL